MGFGGATGGVENMFSLSFYPYLERSNPTLYVSWASFLSSKGPEVRIGIRVELELECNLDSARVTPCPVRRMSSSSSPS